MTRVRRQSYGHQLVVLEQVRAYYGRRWVPIVETEAERLATWDAYRNLSDTQRDLCQSTAREELTLWVVDRLVNQDG